ncbi:MAG: alpha/beta hydrolase [Lachnospiraceae bacterium]|nr:alpha/beta hydrolase [Lachnospiraceae bacterium]
MFYSAKNGKVKIRNSEMEYVTFGKGSKYLIIIPGLGDGLKTVKGMAIMFAIMYRCFAKSHKIYFLSRKNHIEKGYSTRDMAEDYKTATEKLGISKADVFGISQGGMIAQYIAIDYPEAVRKLVLVATLSKQNETVQKVVKNWIKMAEKNDYKNILISSTEKNYTGKRLKRYRLLYPLLTRIGKPKNFNRFIIQADSCINHDAHNELDKIKCPTLVIGVDNDKVVGIGTSEEIAGKIKDSKLIIHEGFGHCVHEEVKDFNSQIFEFLNF